MKICHVVTNEIVNDPRVDRIATALSKKFEVTVLGLEGYRPTLEEKPYKIILSRRPSYGVTESTKKDIQKALVGKKSCIKIMISDIISFGAKANCWGIMEKELKRIDADIYVANDLDTLPFVEKIAKKKKALLIYDAHEFYADSGVVNTYTFKKIFSLIEKYKIKHASAVITVNQSIAEKLQEEYSLKEKPFVLYNIPNHQPIQRQPITKKNTKTRVVYCGRYDKERGLPELVLAMEHLPNKFVLYLQGSGKLEPELRELVDSHKLNQKVIFVDPVPMRDIVDSLRLYDIGVIPYQPTNINNYLCTPNKIFEYMQAGLAIVCSDLPELKRIIYENPLNGEVFDPYDSEDIAKMIVWAATELNALQKNSTEKSKKYTWAREEEKLFRIYEEAICSGKR